MIVQCSQVEADAAALLLVIVRIVSVAGCLLHISLCTTLCNKSRCLHTHNWDLAAMSGLPEHLMGPHTYQLALPCSVELALLPCFLQMHIAFQVYDLVDKHIRELDGDLEAFAADIDNEAQALGLADEETACDRLGLEGGARVRKGAAAAAAAAGGQQGRQKRKAAGRRKGAEAGVCCCCVLQHVDGLHCLCCQGSSTPSMLRDGTRVLVSSQLQCCQCTRPVRLLQVHVPHKLGSVCHPASIATLAS